MLTKRALASIALISVVLLGGCADSDSSIPDDMIATPTVRHPLSDFPGAAIEGEIDVVVTSDRAYFLIEVGTDTFGLVFTQRVFGREGEPFQLVQPDGRVIAMVGDQVDIGGGEYPQGEGAWGAGPDVDQYWLAIVDDEGF